jgi:hypothetical protein
MVWVGVSYFGKTYLIFKNKGVKVNAKYLINKVFKLFLKKDVLQLFPGRINAMIF